MPLTIIFIIPYSPNFVKRDFFLSNGKKPLQELAFLKSAIYTIGRCYLRGFCLLFTKANLRLKIIFKKLLYNFEIILYNRIEWRKAGNFIRPF